MTKIAILLLIILIGTGLMVYKTKSAAVILAPDVKSVSISPTNLSAPESLSISEMRKKNYPGSEISIVNKLSSNASYDRYVTSYYSDGLKIFSLLTIPKGKAPSGGWPVILFNHGYIAPEVYRTGQRYVSYVDYFARNGYVVFMPDYRGNGLSEGNPEGAYYSPAYASDDLNALASIKKYKDVNPNKIGIWGHSMGGNITLRDLV
ncbi:MAG TPA: alpha/beta fold hydrolase, partial [Patescibacteria group bacterium]